MEKTIFMIQMITAARISTPKILKNLEKSFHANRRSMPVIASTTMIKITGIIKRLKIGLDLTFSAKLGSL